MPLSEQQLLERDQQRDLNAELLQSVDEMVSGCVAAHHHIDLPDIVNARQNVGASQSAFAELLGVSRRTLQEWEQGRRKLSDAARSLIQIAIRHPEVLKALQV
jgi:putative transcriptional regulator